MVLIGKFDKIILVMLILVAGIFFAMAVNVNQSKPYHQFSSLAVGTERVTNDNNQLIAKFGGTGVANCAQGYVLIWSNVSGTWICATSNQGPAGPQGPAGATGPQGYAGATGAAGPQGAAGADGAKGATGPQGYQGAAGPTGATGPVGAAGPVGAKGATGATGPAGPGGQTAGCYYNGHITASGTTCFFGSSCPIAYGSNGTTATCYSGTWGNFRTVSGSGGSSCAYSFC
jgi:hypothetical protein